MQVLIDLTIVPDRFHLWKRRTEDFPMFVKKIFVIYVITYLLTVPIVLSPDSLILASFIHDSTSVLS